MPDKPTTPDLGELERLARIISPGAWSDMEGELPGEALVPLLAEFPEVAVADHFVDAADMVLPQALSVAQRPFWPGFDGWTVHQTGGYGAVPEPSAWVLMIVGMGLVGMGLRFQRRFAW